MASKQADDEFAAADKADCDARQANNDAKQAEKDADAALKSAVKACIDSKAEEKKNSDQLKKLQTNVESLQRKVQDFSLSMSPLSSAKSKISALDRNNEAQKAKFDKASESLAEEMAKMADWELQVSHCNAEKLRICREARESEMEEIVQNMTAAREELLQELDDAEAQYAVIAKLRADRIATFGEAEIARRVQIQSKIYDLKRAENNRSDHLPRICNVCGSNAGNAFQCDRHICVFAEARDRNVPYVKPTFKVPGANYVSVSVPSLDGHFWGSDFEGKSEAELTNYPFQEDIVFNPYSSWWSSFIGPYYINGVKVDRKMEREGDTPTADEAFSKLPATLKPTPALTAVAERFCSVFQHRRGQRVTLEDDQKRLAFFREKLQQGPVSEQGDRFDFMRYHSWYATTALSAFCKDCGLDPQTFKKL
jgi:hypothetical protein